MSVRRAQCVRYTHDARRRTLCAGGVCVGGGVLTVCMWCVMMVGRMMWV